MLFSSPLLSFSISASRAKIRVSGAALRVSCCKQFQQSSLFPARRLAESKVPLCQRAAQFAELSFERGELSGDKFANTLTRSPTAVASAKDVSQFANGKADAERGPSQLNTAERVVRENPVARRRTRRSGQKATAFVKADWVAAYARESRQFTGIHGPIFRSVCTHRSSVRVGVGSKVKRISAYSRLNVKYLVNAAVPIGRRDIRSESACSSLECKRSRIIRRREASKAGFPDFAFCSNGLLLDAL
jgi:hypothetical protein